MPSESSNPECGPTAETPPTPGPGSALGPVGIAPTLPGELALTALDISQPLAGAEGASPSRRAGAVGTIAEGASTQAGSAQPRSPGRLPRYLGEYELLEEIARGGMGIVYRARQEKLNRLVAVKLIRSGSLAGEDDLRRFRHEAEAIADLDHPHIIPIYEIGQEDDQPYFSMKLIEGGNLAAHIPRLKDDPNAVAKLIAKVARAVHYAHQRTILHRDIKPSNILLAEHDEPYVTDFGLAKRIGLDSGSAATMTGAVMGTPAYMPPEQARGTKSVTTAADIYSLGATLYEALTGQPPFAGESSAEIMRLVLEQEPARLRAINPNLDRDLETICLKCLRKEPARRYGSAEALAEDLERWRAGLPIAARPVPTWEKAVMWVKRRRAFAALLLVLHVALLGLFGGGIWFTLELWRERDMANRGRYAADMSLARRALDDGLIYQVREQLKTYQSGPRALADLRSFEWYYLANLCDSAPIRLRGHGKAVICLAFHPDGNRVASGGADGTVRIWDLSGRREPHVIPAAGGVVHCVAFSPDGRLLAAGGGTTDKGGHILVWDASSGQLSATVDCPRGVDCLSFSHDSLRIATCGSDAVVQVWDATGGHETLSLNGHGGRVSAVLFAPSDLRLYSAGRDGVVKLWDGGTKRLGE